MPDVLNIYVEGNLTNFNSLLLFSQVPAEKRDSWLYKEAEAKMKEEYHIVEFKRYP